MVTYTFTVHNAGNVTMHDISVTDPKAGLSAITPATISTLAPGADAVFHATYTVRQTDIDAGNIHNAATGHATAPGAVDPIDSNEAALDIPIAQHPALTVKKTSTAGTNLKVDDTVTYTFTIKNTGNVTLDEVSITDLLPGVSATTPLSEDHLVPGETTQFTATYIVTQADVDAGKIVNSATAHAVDPKSNPVVSNPSDLTLPIDQNPALVIDKTSDVSGPVAIGQTITYTFTVTNSGNVTVHGLSVTDNHANLGVISPATIASLDPHKIATFTATYLVTQSDMDAGKVVNSATANGTDTNNQPVVSAPDTLTILTAQQPGLKITKTYEAANGLEVGDTITYKFAVLNTGNTTLDSVQVVDAMTGLSVLTPDHADHLVPGETSHFTATYTITQADMDAGLIHNSALSTGVAKGTGSSVTSAPSVLDIPLDKSPHISVTKSSNATGPVVLGQTITYTFDVVNDGNVTLENISVTDGLSGLSAVSPTSFATLAPTQHATFTATYVVRQSDLDRGVIHNQATAQGTPTGALTPITSAPAKLDVQASQQPALMLVKSRLGTGALTLNSLVTYEFLVTNSGNVTLTTISVTDPMPGLSPITPTTVVTLLPGESATFTATYQVAQGNLDAGHIKNTAQAHGTLSSSGATVDSNKSTLIIPLGQTPALSISKRSTAGTNLTVGQTVTYTFIVKNTGNVTLDGVHVVDPKAGLSVITPVSEDHLVPGETTSFTATYVVTQDDIDAGSIENSATALGVDPNSLSVESDPSLLELPIDQHPTLSVVKSADKTSPVALGTDITYTIKVTNSGNVTLYGVSVSDLLAGIGPISPTSVASLAPNAVATFTVHYTVTQADMNAGKIVNSATAHATDPNDDPVTSNPGSVTLTTDQHPALTIVKSRLGDDPLVLNSIVTYSFVVTNSGNIAIHDVAVTDLLPGISALAPTTVASLNDGESATFIATYKITQDDVDAGKIVNQATAHGLTPQNSAVDSSPSKLTLLISQGPSISIDKTADTTGPVAIGQHITYTFVVTNTGNVTLSTISVTDPLPGLGAITPSAPVAILIPGGAATFTASYIVTQRDMDAGRIVNTATGHAKTAVGTAVDSPPDSVTLLTDQKPVLTIDKTSNATAATKKDDTITYSFLVTNNGNTALHNVTVTDPLAGLNPIAPVSVANLAPGDTFTFTATYKVTQTDIDRGTIHNSATAHGFADGTNSSVTSTPDALDVPLTQRAHLTIDKTSDATPATAIGDTVTYYFNVTNDGNVTLTNILVTDLLPGLSTVAPAAVATLLPGASTLFSATYVVTSADMEAGKITNSASATGTNPGHGAVTSEPDELTINLTQRTTLQLIKSADRSTFTRDGDQITYTFTVTNTGNVAIANVHISDPMFSAGQIAPANVQSLFPGKSVEFTATYTATRTDMLTGFISNTATASGQRILPIGPVTITSNESSKLVTLTAEPALDLVKTSDATAGTAVNDQLTYSFTVTNIGNVTLTNITVADPLTGLGAITPSSVTSLLPGESVDFHATYTVSQLDVDHGAITNTATATGAAPDAFDGVRRLDPDHQSHPDQHTQIDQISRRVDGDQDRR